MQDTHSQAVPASRIVLFMTQERAEDVPAMDHLLACMLPLGTASFAERVMDSCALAGVRQIDIVVSEHPEALRAALQDGAPWGIQLNWHYAKESASPYTALRSMGLKPADRVVVGHAHQWVNSRIVRELMQATAAAMCVTNDVAWTGWLSARADALLSLSHYADYAALAERANNTEGTLCITAGSADFAQNLCAADLLASQQHALDGTQEAAIPASWLRMPWGAASPDAVIHADAHMHGPVLVGAGCVVESGAELGPATVLAPEVFVASGARVRNSLVMANTYVGGQISLENALAQGNSIQSLRWSVRTVLNPSDALMVPLRAKATVGTPWTSRLTAALALLISTPLLIPALATQKPITGHLFWRSDRVVQSRLSGQDDLVYQTVRQPHSQHRLDRWIAHWGAVFDIAQGRRNWFGLRPRLESEWSALGSDWQELFSHTAIGLIHAPAWSEKNGNLDNEAYAAADAFMAVQSTMSGRFKILYSHISH